MRGYPYEQTVGKYFVSCTDTLNNLAKSSSYIAKLPDVILKHQEDLQPLFKLGFHGLDNLVKNNSHLTYEQAFSLISFVLLTSNNALYTLLAPKVYGFEKDSLEKNVLLLHAVSLLQSMSTRESLIGLSPIEIAGMIAATIDLDTVAKVHATVDKPVFAIGGMGGDKGLTFDHQTSKLFSISTLAALTLGNFGLVHKHHSYPNTSKVAGQSAIESFGARSDFDSEERLSQAIDHSGIIMTSCHNTRTIHTISHLLKGETINHVIGPSAFPHNNTATLNALIGVNHNVHPNTYTEALRILCEKGVQSYGNSVACCGLNVTDQDTPLEILNETFFYGSPNLKQLVALDEISPPPFLSIASFLVEGKNIGSFILAPADFMTEEELQFFSNSELLIANDTRTILEANQKTILGLDDEKIRYVAMTAALAIFTKDYSAKVDAFDFSNRRVNKKYLRSCFQSAYQSLKKGEVEKSMHLYVESTQKDSLPGIDLVIFDIDNTLVYPDNPHFYQNYSDAVERAIAKYLDIPHESALKVANFYREHYGGGEFALAGMIGEHFPQFGERVPNFSILYEEMCKIDPTSRFARNEKIIQLLKLLHLQNKKIVGLTDSPEELSVRILKQVGIDPQKDFDAYIAYRKEIGPPKMIQNGKIFKEIAVNFGISPERIISIGDSIKDVTPSERIGMKTCLISQDEKTGYTGLRAHSLFEVFQAYRDHYGN